MRASEMKDQRQYAREARLESGRALYTTRKNLCIKIHPSLISTENLLSPTNGLCWICLEKIPTTLGLSEENMEHLYPLFGKISKRVTGHHVAENLLPAHRTCNLRKMRLSPLVFAKTSEQIRWVNNAKRACKDADGLHLAWLRSGNVSVTEIPYDPVPGIIFDNYLTRKNA